LAELLDLFLVGKLGGNRLAPAGPPGNNDLSLARGRAVAYVFHGKNLSIRPASAGHFFVVANCCYRRSCRCRFSLLERAPQPKSDFGVQRPEGALGRGLKQAPQIFLEPHIQFWRSTGFVH
jgi:hypothetical protein